MPVFVPRCNSTPTSLNEATDLRRARPQRLRGHHGLHCRDNPAAAVRFGEGLLKTADLLEQNPELGFARDELAKGLRVFAYRDYGLYYRIDAQQQAVILERVLHPALDVRRQSFD